MFKIKRLPGLFMTILLLFTLSGCVTPASALNRSADQTVKDFRQQVKGADIFLNQAAGYLVFPRIIKAGAGVGGETGEGVLRVGGSPVSYYRIDRKSVV